VGGQFALLRDVSDWQYTEPSCLAKAVDPSMAFGYLPEVGAGFPSRVSGPTHLVFLFQRHATILLGCDMARMDVQCQRNSPCAEGEGARGDMAFLK